MLLAVLLFCSLSRAELIERFRAPVVTQFDGFVRVYADCPADMRREYQLPVAGFVSRICRQLSAAEPGKRAPLPKPGIVLHVGDGRTVNTAVVTRVESRADGGRLLRVYLPSPGSSDRSALRAAAVKGYHLAVHGTLLDDRAARQALRDADPVLRATDDQAELVAWRREGKYEQGRDDEAYLKLQRKVLIPGRATPTDVETFRSRLMLYPAFFALPFAGRHEQCSFEEAIDLARRDPLVRYAAFRKVTEIILYGGGRGEKMSAAVEAYAAFLQALAGGQTAPGELRALLRAADEKLKGVGGK